MKRTARNYARQALVVAAAAVFAAPLVWMVLSSFKSGEQIASRPHEWLPRPWRWQNYVEAVTAAPYATYLRNSLFLAVGSVIGTLVGCATPAYALARLRFPGRDLALLAVLGTMLLPWHVTMIPRFLLIRELGLYNSLWALVLPTFFGNAFYIFLLRQFFLSVPQELIEAARIDGCGEGTLFLKIVLPLARPAVATVALFQFVAAWNDFNGPLLYLRDREKFPLAYGLEQFVSAYSSQTHLLLAAAVLFTLPMIALFFLAQRLFVEGLGSTGMKE